MAHETHETREKGERAAGVGRRDFILGVLRATAAGAMAVWGVLLLSVRIVDRERRARVRDQMLLPPGWTDAARSSARALRRRADGGVVRGSWPYD